MLHPVKIKTNFSKNRYSSTLHQILKDRAHILTIHATDLKKCNKLKIYFYLKSNKCVAFFLYYSILNLK